jgi:peptide/nickel transport system permease protein
VTRYLVSRVAQAIATVVAIAAATFVLIHLVPGDPARISLGPQASQESVDDLRHSLRLDEPVGEQLAGYLGDLATLDFGSSIRFRQPVTDLVGPRIGPSLLLIAMSLAIALAVSLPLAVVAARRRNRATDHTIRVFSMVTFAMPSFWLALLLVLVFSLQLGWLPSSGYGTGFAEHVRSLILPATTVGLFVAPVLLRTMRSSVIETLDEDYVDAARARGLGERRVMARYVVRNSLLSTVTVVGVFVGGLLSTAVVVENVFSIPGLGSLLVDSVSQRDFPTIQALTIVFGCTVVAINLLTDLLYLALDPRVRL